MLVQRLCIWSGIAGATLIFIALLPLMGFIPAPRPSASAAEIAALYRGNALGIIGGATLMVSAFGLLVPFYALISKHIEAMEDAGSPLAKAQFGLALLAVCVPGAVGSILWMAAAFRPDRSDEIIRLLNDLGWMLIFTPVVSGLVQTFVIAIAIFTDRSRAPAFPRWYAYFNVWIGISFLPGGLLGFFKTGILAWNGLLCFWLGLSAFGVWFIATAVVLMRAARR